MAVVDSGTSEILGAFVVMLAGFFTIAKVMLKQSSKDREADRQERIKLSDAISLMAKNSGKVAEATAKGAAEAKTRNGHLGEQNVQIAKMLKEQNADVHEISTTLKSSVVTLAKDTKAAAIRVAEVKSALENEGQ